MSTTKSLSDFDRNPIAHANQLHDTPERMYESLMEGYADYLDGNVIEANKAEQIILESITARPPTWGGAAPLLEA